MNYQSEKSAAVKKIIPSLILFVVGFAIFFSHIGTGDFFSRIGMGFIGGLFFGGAVWGLFLTKAWFYPMGVMNAEMQQTRFDATAFMKSFRLAAWIFVSCFVGPFAMIAGFAKVIGVFAAAKKAQNSAGIGYTENE